jgi:hypothetical protein
MMRRGVLPDYGLFVGGGKSGGESKAAPLTKLRSLATTRRREGLVNGTG